MCEIVQVVDNDRQIDLDANGRSRHKYLGGPADEAGRALSPDQTTARPSPQAVSARSGHDRSAKNIGGHTPASTTSRSPSLSFLDWQPRRTALKSFRNLPLSSPTTGLQ